MRLASLMLAAATISAASLMLTIFAPARAQSFPAATVPPSSTSGDFVKRIAIPPGGSSLAAGFYTGISSRAASRSEATSDNV